jgi:hypothetical protein
MYRPDPFLNVELLLGKSFKLVTLFQHLWSRQASSRLVREGFKYMWQLWPIDCAAKEEDPHLAGSAPATKEAVVVPSKHRKTAYARPRGSSVEWFLLSHISG